MTGRKLDRDTTDADLSDAASDMRSQSQSSDSDGAYSEDEDDRGRDAAIGKLTIEDDPQLNPLVTSQALEAADLFGINDEEDEGEEDASRTTTGARTFGFGVANAADAESAAAASLRAEGNAQGMYVLSDASGEDKRKRKKVYTICLTNCKYDVVRDTAKKLGLREIGEDEDWSIFWTDTSVSMDRACSMKKYQKINHFPGMSEICRKDCLARNLGRMRRLFPKDFCIAPRTWVLPAE